MNETERPKRSTFSPTPAVAEFLFQPHHMPTTFSVNRCVIYHMLAMEETELPSELTKADVNLIADYVLENEMAPPMSRGELAALHMVVKQDLSEELGTKVEQLDLLQRMNLIEEIRSEIIRRYKSGSTPEKTESRNT